jgi:hypothetical protein
MGSIARPAALVGLGVLVSGPNASAQGDDPSALAEALFRNGRDLMAEGRFPEACPKFAESQRVDPKPGTLINLALCHEKTGRTASAWAEYLEVAESARRAGQVERETVAREHARLLESALPHVVVDADPSYGAQVVLDDRPLGPGAFRTPIPIDPGDHVIRATAWGRKPFSEAFVVPTGSGTRTLRLPALAPSRGPVPFLGTAVPGPEVPAEPQPWLDARRAWGLVAGGAGLALVGAGAFFGLRAFSDKRTADNECNADFCTQLGLNAIGAMKTAEAISTVSVAAGITALSGGAYLLLSGKAHTGHQASTWRIAPDIGAHGVRAFVGW